MPYFALMYDMVDDFVARRAASATSIFAWRANPMRAANWFWPARWPIRLRARCSSLTLPMRLPPKSSLATIRMCGTASRGNGRFVRGR